MPDRLILKSTHPSDPAADADDPPSQESGKRPPPALPSAFLADLQDRRVTVYLINGIKRVGKVRPFDSYTLLLQDADGIESLLLKHAISRILPGMPMRKKSALALDFYQIDVPNNSACRL